MKDMHNHVNVIEESPSSLRHTFSVMNRLPFGLEAFNEVLCGTTHVSI